jgi:TPR repeat protein
MLLQGEGVSPDPQEGFRWLVEAASYGVPSAQQSVGALLAEGRYVAADLVEAYKWYRLLSGSNPQASRQGLDWVSRRMSRQQIDEAERAARSWVPRPSPFKEGPLEP